jgi:tetratricopeptide (TPR) repeat protein
VHRLAIAFVVLSVSRLFSQSSEASLQSYFEQGEKALADGQFSEAEAAYLKLTKLAPNVAEVYGRLGLVYFQEKRFDEAVPVLRKALKLKPSLPNTDILLAMSLSEVGQYAEALPGLDKGFHHTNDPALKRLSGLQLERTYIGLRRDSDGVQTALELARLYPNDPEVLYYAGRLFGNYAFLSMQKLAEVAPESVWRHEAAADAYQSAGSYDLAAAEYRQVLAQTPNRPGIHYRLGRTLLDNASHSSTSITASDAAKEFEQELALDPTNANAAYELAEIHRKAGELDKARELFADALKHYPDFEEANVGLGRSLIALGKPEQALAYLTKATELQPRDGVSYYQLALAYRALGKPEQQKAAFDKFQQLKTDAASSPDLLRPGASVTKQEVQ